MYTFLQNSLIRLSLCLAIILATGCAHLQSLQSQDLWQSGGKPLTDVTNPLVLVLAGDTSVRKRAEVEWVLSLRDSGIAAAPSYAPLPDLAEVTPGNLHELNKKHGIDALFMASLSLDRASAQTRHDQLQAHLDYRINLAFDVFVHQVELAVVNVSAFSLASEKLLWRSVYYVPVREGQVDWGLVARSANQDMAAAGLQEPVPVKPANSPPEKPQKAPHK
ncbi:MAG: hypothetical protein R3208_08330 [Ketobacteraceae bacterium]|nr:hypothetical protein [Ketobacteraceae bacterium]